MKNKEIKKYFEELTALEQYFDAHDIRNSGVNKIIIYNLKRLAPANDVIKKSTSKELIDLENKIFEDAKEAYFALPPEVQKQTVPFLFALSRANTETLQKREKLLISYNELLEEDGGEINLYYLEDRTKIDQVDLIPRFQRIIESYIKQD